MGRIILRGLLHLLCFALLAVAWFACARSISLLVDKMRTAPVESRSVGEFGVGDLDGGMLRIDNVPFNMAGPDLRPSALRMSRSAQGQLIAQIGNRSIALGRRTDSLGTIRPGAGESARFRIERSLLSWPTPLEINFMTGVSPSWKRHLYYRLNWQKQTGRKLVLVWRYEQWFYPGNGWASGFMTRAGSTGLVLARVQ